jgi:hypothetical protein
VAILKEFKKQEFSRQYTSGNPFQRGQQDDQIQAGRLVLKRHTEVKSSKLENPCPG